MSRLSKMKKQVERRKFRVRSKLRQLYDNDKVRVSIHKSLKYTSAQVINDFEKKTIFSIGTQNISSEKANVSKIDQAFQAGFLLGKKLKEAEYESIIFDRGSYLYHGRIKAFADGIRSAGVSF